MRTSIDLATVPKVMFPGNSDDELEPRRATERSEEGSPDPKQEQPEARDDDEEEEEEDRNEQESSLFTGLHELKPPTIDSRNTILGISGDFEQEVIAALGLGEDKSDAGFDDFKNYGKEPPRQEEEDSSSRMKDDGDGGSRDDPCGSKETTELSLQNSLSRLKVPSENASLVVNRGSDLDDDDDEGNGSAGGVRIVGGPLKAYNVRVDSLVNRQVNGESVDSNSNMPNNAIQQRRRRENKKKALLSANGNGAEGTATTGSEGSRFYRGPEREERRGRSRQQGPIPDASRRWRTPSPDLPVISRRISPEQRNKPLPPLVQAAESSRGRCFANNVLEAPQRRQWPANRNHASNSHQQQGGSRRTYGIGHHPDERPYHNATGSIINAMNRENFDDGITEVHYSQLQEPASPTFLSQHPPVSQRNRSRSPIARFRKAGTTSHRSPLAAVSSADDIDSEAEERGRGGNVLNKLSVCILSTTFFSPEDRMDKLMGNII